MNKITTCPNCLTRFIVGRAQLKANQGQVKCAKCQHVFDFRQHLESSHEQTVFLGEKGLKMRRNRRTYLVVGLLVLLALAQIAFFARGHIAVIWPASQSTMIKACQLLRCTIELPRKIALIELEDSELTKDENVANLIKFSAQLTNNAPYTQAYPDLALTLTDDKDQPLILKLIKPDEYANNLGDGLKAGEELHININLQTTEPVVGFRAVAFYR